MLKEEGWTCQKVEWFNAYTMRMTDLFGIIDAVCVRPGVVLGIQATDHTSASKHRKKIDAEPRTQAWLASGAKLDLHLWKKVGSRWQVKIERIGEAV